MFSFTYDIANPFNVKLIHNDSALEYNINDALIAVGFSGTIPIVSLESRFMTIYTTGAGNDYITAHDLVKDTGDLSSTAPAVLKTLVGGTGIALSNDANNFTISTYFDIADYTTTTTLNTGFYKTTDFNIADLYDYCKFKHLFFTQQQILTLRIV